MNVLRGRAKANSYSLAEDMIFNNGLHKKWFRKSSDDTSPRCVYVIGQAWSVTHWNDQPYRRKADVCEALLAAASLSMDGEDSWAPPSSSPEPKRSVLRRAAEIAKGQE